MPKMTILLHNPVSCYWLKTSWISTTISVGVLLLKSKEYVRTDNCTNRFKLPGRVVKENVRFQYTQNLSFVDATQKEYIIDHKGLNS